jgi:hypothetical protein
LQDWGQDPKVGQVVRHEPDPADSRNPTATANAPSTGATQRVSRPAPDVPGNYLLFYSQLRDHLAGHGPIPVTPAQVRQVMAVLTLGEQSARDGRFLAL